MISLFNDNRTTERGMVTSYLLKYKRKEEVCFYQSSVSSRQVHTVSCYVKSRQSTMSESLSVKRGLFPKKVENKDGEKSATSEKTKRGKHKREKSMASAEASRLETPEDHSGTEGATAEITSNVKAPKEKKKAKNLAHRLSFGKGGRKKKKIRFTEEKENIYLEEPAPYSIEWREPPEGDSVKEGLVQQMVSQIEGNSEPKVEESLPAAAMTIIDVPEDVSSEIESLVPVPACSTVEGISLAVKTTIQAELEGPKEIVPSTGILGEAFTNLKQLVINNEKLLHVNPSGRLQYVVSLYASDFGLAKLIGFWSFLLNRASEATKQVLVYFITSLIKKYPQCFKVQLKKIKEHQRKKLEAAKQEMKAAQTLIE